MAGVAGHMADVTWKVLERRARTKRSGLAGWGAALTPRTAGGASPQVPGVGDRWGRGHEQVSPRFSLAGGGQTLHLITPVSL